MKATDPQQAMQNRLPANRQAAFMAATAPAAPAAAAAPAASFGQVTSAITPYQPAPLGEAQGLLNAGMATPAPTAAGASPGVASQQSNMWENLLSGPLSSANVGLEEQAAKMDAQLGLNRAVAGGQSGVGLMGSGMGFLANRLLAQQPMDQFKSRMATLPINMLSGLFGRRT